MKRTIYRGVENNLLRKHISLIIVIIILTMSFCGVVFQKSVSAADIDTENGNAYKTTKSEKLDILSYCLIFLLLAIFLILVIIYLDTKIK